MFRPCAVPAWPHTGMPGGGGDNEHAPADSPVPVRTRAAGPRLFSAASGRAWVGSGLAERGDRAVPVKGYAGDLAVTLDC